MSYSNIPAELQAIPQWCNWRYEDIGASKPTKVPYNPKTGEHANVNDPKTWCDYDTVVALVADYSGIGFIFTDDDNYSFIDLDDVGDDQIALQRQIEIFRDFDSYSEISPSGKGLHIIVKGKVPAGRRRSHIEIYSSQRYATFTGNIYNNKPIKDCQDKLMRLWQQMGDGPVAHTMYQGDQQEKQTDEEIYANAKNAVNGTKFERLYNGEWSEAYQSQSEADFALIDIISFYTQNRSQISRIFQSSKLGSRAKAKRQDYLAWMINKSFDRMLPPIDFDGFKNQLESKLVEQQLSMKLTEGKKQNIVLEPELPLNEQRKQNENNNNVDNTFNSNKNILSSVELPPGLLGEIAQFIYQTAPRPVPEIALAGAIGLLAGICGRAYNISGTGLNHYVLLLADTGAGKEAMAIGIDKLMEKIRFSVPTSMNYIGPSEIASGQALIKHINKFSQCFVSILGEFGLRIQQLSSQRASSAEIMLRRMLLDLYNKSGAGQMFRGSIYADRDKNVDATRSPSFTILGESTPERFYGALNEDMISEGLLPRFLIIEYIGPRPVFNKNATSAPISFTLGDQFSALVAQCETVVHQGRVVNVQCDPIAQKMLDDFDTYADALINKADKDIVKQLWNRAHIKALKLSALVAVGVNMIVPTILPSYVEWAINIVRADIKALSNKFDQGMIGANTNEIKQMVEAIKKAREYFTKPWEAIKSYCPSCQDLHHHKIIPYEYFSTRVSTLSAFKNDRLGQTIALKRVIQSLMDNGKLEEITKTRHYLEKFNRGSKRAFIAKAELFD